VLGFAGHATHFVFSRCWAEHCSCSTQQIDKRLDDYSRAVALRPWVVNEAAGSLLRFVRSDFIFSVGIFDSSSG